MSKKPYTCYFWLPVCTARPIDIICVITRNRHNKFILREETCPISKRRELEIGLEFKRNGLDGRKNYSKGSFKPKKDTQVIRVERIAVLLLHTNRNTYIVNTTVGWESLTIR